MNVQLILMFNLKTPSLQMRFVEIRTYRYSSFYSGIQIIGFNREYHATLTSLC
jgi:hypothetical protein